MPIQIDDLPTIRSNVKGFFRNRFVGWALGLRSFLGKLADVFALTIMALLRAVKSADNDAVPRAKTSTQGLNDWAFALGIPSNEGGFGRNGATTASGGVGVLTGAPFTVFTDGIVAVAEDGVTQVKLSGTVTLPVDGGLPGNFVAVTPGSVGNLEAGTVLTWQSPPSGADSTVTLTTGLSGGLDDESNSELLGRELDRLQQPPKGGAAVDYRTWAASGDPAVKRSYVYPNGDGLGSVIVAVTQGGSGTGRLPTAGILSNVQAYIDSKRPVAVNEAKAIAPATSTGKVIKLRVVPSADKYNFDWDDTSGPFTVDTYTAGHPATLKLNTLAPASLKAAIDAGKTPRLQVFATSLPTPYVVQVRATAWVDGGGKTTLTLEDPLPTGFTAPVATDAVFAGGPVVDQTALALANYVDSLGPSRANGHADPNDPWDDTITVAKITDIAMEQLDADGVTKIIKNVLVGSVLVAGVNADYQAQVLGGVPEMLFAKYIQVTD